MKNQSFEYRICKVAENVQLIRSINENNSLKSATNEQISKFAELCNNTLAEQRSLSYDYLLSKGKIKKAVKIIDRKAYINEIVRICDNSLIALKKELKFKFSNELIKMF
jgi:hypothetical protein